MRRPFLLGLSCVLLASCGKDETDFEDLKGQIGSVPGAFNVRLAPLYRDQIDGLQNRLDSFVPGASAQLLSRFGSEAADATDENGTRLSDLLKVKLPATESAFVNKQMFGELTQVAGDQGPYFDVVDTEKYLQGPTNYTPPAPGDERFSDQYYLDMIRWREGVAGIDALLQQAAPVVVAVLDTGVRADHEDLSAVMWQNSSGAVGYDAGTGRPLSRAESVDSNGHGTHVAGIIGGLGSNGKGIHGVAYLPGREGDATKSITEIMNVRVLNDNGAGTSEQIGQGLKWAVDQHRAQKGARPKQKMVINMSLGGPFETSGYTFKKGADGLPRFEDDMINYAVKNGDVLVVVAAGNETCGIGGSCNMFGESYRETYYYPCSYENVLCVAATTHEEKLAGFSNRRASVGLAAPGYQIYSTLGGSPTDYGYYSGTSQATPVVAGTAAVVWSLYPALSANDVKLILQKSSAKIADVSGELSSAQGRVDLEAALAYAAQLKAAKAAPATTDPAAGIVKTDKSTPAKAPPVTGDPYAPSENATAHVPADKGKGSAKGCGVIPGALGAKASLAWVFLGLVPLVTVWPRRRRR